MTEPSPISSTDELIAALQLAVGVELSTIPVYLTALYSIKDGHNEDAAQTIRSVVMEEMLHMTLAANVLNALGHAPSIAPVVFKDFGPLSPVPSYPLASPLISGLGTLELLRFSPEAVRNFVTIEHPLHGAAQLSAIPGTPSSYRTIGQFYDAITAAVKAGYGEFTAGRPQVPGTQYYGGAGQVIPVTDRDSAQQAIDRIVAEGEGLPTEQLHRTAKEPIADGDTLRGGWQMYSHYARFRELQCGRRFRRDQSAEETPRGAAVLVDYEAVHPASSTGEIGDNVESAAVIEFDLAYSELVDELYLAFSDRPESRLPAAVHRMYELRDKAVGLMRTPNPRDRHRTLCPRFRYLAGADRNEQRRRVELLRSRAVPARS